MVLAGTAAGADGLVSVKSPHSAKDTMNRLEESVKQRGLTVFARIDHAAGAAKVGKTLRPAEVLALATRRAARRSWSASKRRASTCH
jgi:uncharacterized protein (DUF302 family)